MKKLTLLFLVLFMIVSCPLSVFAETEEQVAQDITETLEDIEETVTETETFTEDTIIYDSTDYTLQLEVLHDDLQQTITAIMVGNFIMCVALSIFVIRIFI